MLVSQAGGPDSDPSTHIINWVQRHMSIIPAPKRRMQEDLKRPVTPLNWPAPGSARDPVSKSKLEIDRERPKALISGLHMHTCADAQTPTHTNAYARHTKRAGDMVSVDPWPSHMCTGTRSVTCTHERKRPAFITTTDNFE